MDVVTRLASLLSGSLITDARKVLLNEQYLRMAPDGLVKVWILLQSRLDISSIVREILGHFPLISPASPTYNDDVFKLMVWIKVIFDLQRTHLQARRPSSESLSCILPSGILFDTIRHVLEMISGMNSQTQNATAEFVEQRYFVARVLLSGLRALLLTLRDDDSFSAQDLDRVRHQLQAWRLTAQNMSERFMLEQCRNLVLEIDPSHQTESDLRKPACRTCDLPGRRVRLHGQLAASIRRAFDDQRAALPTGDARSFWALFDILWAAEVDYIQWRSNTISGLDYSVGEYDCDVSVRSLATKLAGRELYSVTVLLNEWRDKLRRDQEPVDRLLGQIDASLEDLQEFLDERKSTLLDSNMEIQKLSRELQDSMALWIGSDPYNDLRRGSTVDERPPLEAVYVLNCKSLHAITETNLMRQLNRPISYNGTREVINTEDIQIRCPRCSTVARVRLIDPLALLAERLEAFSQNSTGIAVKSFSDPIRAWQERSAPHIAHATRSMSASAASTGSYFIPAPSPSPPTTPLHIARPQPLPQQPSPQAQVHAFVPNTITPINSEPRRASTATSNSDNSSKGGPGWGQRITRKARTFTTSHTAAGSNNAAIERPSATELHPIVSLRSYGFSHDGTVLLLWDRSRNHVYASPIPLIGSPENGSVWDWSEYPLPKPKYVVAGQDIIAGLSENNKILVFSRLSGVDILRQKKLDGELQIKSVSMSFDQKYLAVGLESTIQVYEIDNIDGEPEIYNLLLDPNSKFNSQKTNFSHDGNKLVVAARYSTGDIKIAVFDRGMARIQNGVQVSRNGLQNGMQVGLLWSKTTGRVNILSNDFGPIAVLYSGRKNRVALPSFVNSSYFAIHSEANKYAQWDPNRQGKIHAAVQYPSGSEAILLNAKGELFNLNIDRKTFDQLATAPLGTSKELPTATFVSLAMPNNNTLCAFWMKDNHVFFKVRSGEGVWESRPFSGPTG